MIDVEITDNSKEILETLEKAKERALFAIGLAAEAHAKEKTPVDTGRLRNSITHVETTEATYIGSNVEYAPAVELGSRTNKAVHMLQQAATNYSSEYKAIAESSFKEA